jgi:hypothetical protein
VLFWFGTIAATHAQPIALHPDNPHYFLWRGQPAVLITSAEHYGAVLNLDFDYRRYLDTLAAEGMMLTRTFSGAYVEPAGAFNIARNTLAPSPERFICPWARSNQPGYANGGNKFDLSRWDDSYFARLKDFVRHAAQQGIVVEFTLFCPMYEEKQWELSPMNARNNVNQLEAIGRNDVHTLDRNGPLLAIQERLTRKLVSELNEFDNVMFEICNEPYFGGVTLEWQHHIADVIHETERTLSKQHLITQNIANNQAKIESPHPRVSVFNFHYATPPDTVALNYGLQKVIGDNETGFRGTQNLPYRTEGWDFVIAGGGLYNNLDYSFVAGNEDGTFEYPSTQPGGGNTQLRRELRILRDFIHGFNLTRLHPDNSVIRGGVPASGSARALVDPDRALAIYVRSEGSTGPWSARWTSLLEPPRTGEYQLHTVSNDGVRLWLDDQLLIDDWTDHSEKEDSATVRLEAGKRYRVRLEYFYNGGQGVTRLRWTPPDGEKVAVPANAFRQPYDGWGLQGEYFRGIDLQHPIGSRGDGTIDFAWGIKPPLEASERQREPIVLQVAIPAGDWRAEWIDTKSGAIAAGLDLQGGGVCELPAPDFDHDVALRLTRQ